MSLDLSVGFAQVRRRDSWHRWTTLAMLANDFLTFLAAVMDDAEPDKDCARLVAISLGEARRLFAALATAFTTTLERTAVSTTLERALAWSRWRRRHQLRAQQAHHQRREGSVTAAHRPDLRL